MRRLALFVLMASVTAPVWAQQASELAWTKVAAGSLENTQSSSGPVRLNNLVVARNSGSDPAGAATEHEFSASVANRGDVPLRVVVQIVGVGADGTPTLSAEASVSVDPRRNEEVRQSFRANEGALAATHSYWIHATAAP